MAIETQEVKHKHSKSQQFFYILQGQATFIIDDKEYKVDKNQANENLEFLVISQPHSHGDKIIENE